MPSNVVIINGKEFNVPDSWMPPFWEYLKLIESKVENAKQNRKAKAEDGFASRRRENH